MNQDPNKAGSLGKFVVRMDDNALDKRVFPLQSDGKHNILDEQDTRGKCIHGWRTTEI